MNPWAMVLAGWLCAMSCAHAQVGFHAPEGVGDDFRQTDFSLVNVYLHRLPDGGVTVAADEVLRNFAKVKGAAHRIHLDLGPAITVPREVQRLSTRLVQSNGQSASKVFTPLASNKLRDFMSPADIEAKLRPLAQRLKPHRGNLGCLFLLDEPYMAGVSPAQYDAVARQVRALFKQQGHASICIGVIFASAMFDPGFAKHIDVQMMRYVQGIDEYFRGIQPLLTATNAKGDGARQWVQAIRANRLSTYDQAGNVHTEGGIPQEADVVAFDFYLSTALLDGIHNLTLDWMAANFPQGPCGMFKGVRVDQLRKQLLFFGRQAERSPHTQVEEALWLDRVFACRMSTATDMLDYHLQKAGAGRVQKMLIGESSANGLLEFDAKGQVLPTQNPGLIEQRMGDEVRRYAEFYARNQKRFPAGLMYFTNKSTFDASIQLHVGGAEGFPSVMQQIHELRRSTTPKQRQFPVAPNVSGAR